MSELLRYIPDEVGRNASDVGLKWVFHIPWPLSGLRYYILFIHSFICSFDKCLLSPSAPGTVVGVFSKAQGCDRALVSSAQDRALVRSFWCRMFLPLNVNTEELTLGPWRPTGHGSQVSLPCLLDVGP